MTLPRNFPLLPVSIAQIERASLPEAYRAARKALDHCCCLDEARAIADSMERLAVYARQAHDDDLVNMARRIKDRAIRRCGEVLREIEAGKGGRPPKNRGQSGPSFTRKAVAERAGLSERDRKTALRIASIPPAEFERRVEATPAPSVGALDRIAPRGPAAVPPPVHNVIDLPSRPEPAPEPEVSLRELQDIWIKVTCTRAWMRACPEARSAFLQWIVNTVEADNK